MSEETIKHAAELAIQFAGDTRVSECMQITVFQSIFNAMIYAPEPGTNTTATAVEADAKAAE